MKVLFTFFDLIDSFPQKGASYQQRTTLVLSVNNSGSYNYALVIINNNNLLTG